MKNYAAALAFGFSIALAPGAQAQTVSPPPVPANIAVPDSSQAFFVGRGVGTQNYSCAPGKSLGRVAWTLFTPEATLFDDLRGQLTTHFFSPNPAEGGIVRATWEGSRDSSMVWAKVNASSTDPNFVNQDAVAWLLLQRVGGQAGPLGGDTFAGTTFIQRLNTVGGLAPSTGCDTPQDIGKKAFIPYTADYFFFKK
jgi:hypothetical protein